MNFYQNEFIWQYSPRKKYIFILSVQDFTISHPKPSLKGPASCVLSGGCHVTHGCDCAIYTRTHIPKNYCTTQCIIQIKMIQKCNTFYILYRLKRYYINAK